MNERMYLSEDNISISSSLVKIGGFTYQVKNITSYRAVYGGGSIYTMLPFLVGLAVLAMFIPTQNSIGVGIGVAMILIGLFQVFFCKTLYLITSAEQVRAFTTYNRGRLMRVINALDQAMADNNR